MFKSLADMLKGINGGYEVNRVVGALGALFYIIGTHVFVGYEVFWLDKDFVLTAYCLAFPARLSALYHGTGAAVAIKDRNVATSRVVEATGSKPAEPPAPAPKPQPALVAATESETAAPSFTGTPVQDELANL